MLRTLHPVPISLYNCLDSFKIKSTQYILQLLFSYAKASCKSSLLATETVHVAKVLHTVVEEVVPLFGVLDPCCQIEVLTCYHI